MIQLDYIRDYVVQVIAYNNIVTKVTKKAVYPADKLGLKKAVYPADKLGLKKAVNPAISWELKKLIRVYSLIFCFNLYILQVVDVMIYKLKIVKRNWIKKCLTFRFFLYCGRK